MPDRPSEDELIARHFAPLAGPGALGLRDDAALATPPAGHDLVVTKDMLVAGVHFFADDPPDAIARKALRVNLSDLAAKGAEPSGLLLGLGLPHDWTEAWLTSFAAGLADDCRSFACPVLGGDTVGTPGPLTLSITAFGTVPAGRMVPRTGARAGDTLFATGTIGDAVLGLRIRWDRPEDRHWIEALAQDHRAVLLARHLRPEPRLGLRESLRENARSAMDVSDGFLGDLAKMLRLEGLGAGLRVDAVPLSEAVRAAVAIEPALLEAALGGGDDYELIGAAAPERFPALAAGARAAGIALTAIGTARAGAGVVPVDSSGAPLDFAATRFQHF